MGWRCCVPQLWWPAALQVSCLRANKLFLRSLAIYLRYGVKLLAKFSQFSLQASQEASCHGPDAASDASVVVDSPSLQPLPK